MKLSYLALGVASVAIALSPIWTLPAFAANSSPAVAQTAVSVPRTTVAQPAYFTAYDGLTFTRDTEGVLVVSINRNGAPLTFTARDHTQFTDAFYQIAQDRANKIVILTGNGTDFISGIDFASFGNVASSAVWS
jgi:enoyl-CoA hydratase/carnithine racemase